MDITLRIIRFVSISLLLALTTSLVSAQDKGEEQVLDGTTIIWSYSSSDATMEVSFENGLARYEWIAGMRKGRGDQDIPYNSRQISEGVYLINWVQADKPDFISMIFDFNNKLMFSSGLIGYGTDRQKNLFLSGTISSVEQ